MHNSNTSNNIKSLLSWAKGITRKLIEYYDKEILNSLLRALVVKAKPIPHENTIYCKVQRERDVFAQFYKVHTLLNVVESACQYSILHQAYVMLRKKDTPIEENEMVYNCRTPIWILVPIGTSGNR